DRVNGAEGAGQSSVELAVPLDVGAQAHGAAEGNHLEDPAQRIAGSLGLVYRLDHAPLRLGVRAADFGGLGAAPQLFPRDFQGAQSRFWMVSVMGLPRVRPPRTPEEMWAWSCSIFIRPPRP